MAQQQMNMPPQGAAQAYEKHGSSGVPNSWTFGLFDCFSPFGTCCLSCWCPCIAFGRTHAREQGEIDPSGINGMVCLTPATSSPHTYRFLVLRLLLPHAPRCPFLLAMHYSRQHPITLHYQGQCLRRLLRFFVLPMLRSCSGREGIHRQDHWH